MNREQGSEIGDGGTALCAASVPCPPTPLPRPLTAVVLTGGGARAAYQVGVLRAIRDLLPDPRRNPFPIICGTSAGAVNAASLAAFAEDFGRAVDAIHEVWANFHVNHVYRADALGVALSGGRWLALLMFGWFLRQNPRSVFDNTPLRRLLERTLDFAGIERAIGQGALYAVSITATGYLTGQSITFFQGAPDIQPWSRTQRHAARTRLSVDHLLASSAIPFIFPATRIHREFFGDGSMRQLAPISPAIHLGAGRILVIGSGFLGEDKIRARAETYPSFAQIAGHALASIFLDGLAVDLERIRRINQMLDRLPDGVADKAALGLRPIETLVIAPSQRIELIAAQHVGALPGPVRRLLGGLGGTAQTGAMLASYLLFEIPFTRALIELGYADAMARREDLVAFLAVDASHGCDPG
ncbi:MAG: Patatin [Rhodocyclales bacterium CG17_big_fil_post_rev_8_21_14_2_50_68_7]|nr:MAG: Patatin [Rhodocyclales bacterium CG17_big_fil_post_rev_8_21_14_2_50_68_7]